MKKYKIFIIIFSFFLIYNPPILKINTLHLIGLISWIFIFFHNKTIIEKADKKKISIIFILFILLIIYLILISWINKNSIIVFLDYLFILVDIIPGCLVVNYYCKKDGLSVDEFVLLLLIVGNVQGVIAILSYIFPEIQSLIIQKVINYGFSRSTYLLFLGRRYYGFAYNMVTFAPIVQSILASFCLYFVINKKAKYIFFLPLLCFSATINSRSSFIFLGIGLILVIMMVLLDRLKTKKVIKLILGIIFGFFLFSIILSYFKEHSILTYTWLMDGINEIKVFLLGENTGIFQYIYNNFIWPDGFKFIFGVGINIISSNKYNVNSDIGYVNYFWTGGLIYCVFINAFYFGLLVLIKRKLNNNFGLFLFIYLMSIIIIFAFKMPLLSNNEFVTLVFLLFVFFTFDKKKQKT